jgi:hypothetical protein
LEGFKRKARLILSVLLPVLVTVAQECIFTQQKQLAPICNFSMFPEPASSYFLRDASWRAALYPKCYRTAWFFLEASVFS